MLVWCPSLPPDRDGNVVKEVMLLDGIHVDREERSIGKLGVESPRMSKSVRQQTAAYARRGGTHKSRHM